jgi:hypothetical protein
VVENVGAPRPLLRTSITTRRAAPEMVCIIVRAD